MAVEISKQSMVELAEIVSKAVIHALKDSGLVFGADIPVQPKPKKTEKTAYQQTEQLLFNYNGFKRIVAEREQEIADLRKYGVPQKSASAGGERVQTSHTNVGIQLPEDAVEDAIRTVQRSVEGTVQAIALIDKCMAALKSDPYYKILEMRYFEGRTQEDIAVTFGCNQATIARNKSRLVKELAMRLFPDQVANEIMN